jgi:hypothetical protein
MAIKTKKATTTPPKSPKAPKASKDIIIEKSDLDSLKQLQQDTDRLVYSLGQLYIQKEKLSNTEDGLKKAITQIEQKEEELGKHLSDKYGVGTVNIEAGTFTPRS